MAVKAQDVEHAYILIADDHADTLALLGLQGYKLRWTCDLVHRAEDIVERISYNCTHEMENCYDAIIADINFFSKGPSPSITGIAAISQVRKVRPNMPVLFVSAYVSSIIREEARRLHAEIIQKPFNIDEVFDKLAEMIVEYRDKKANHSEDLIVPKYTNGISIPKRIRDNIKKAKEEVL